MNDPGMINGEVPRRPVTGENNHPRTSSWNAGHNSSNNSSANLSFGENNNTNNNHNEGGGGPSPTDDTANLRSLSMDDAISLLRDRQQATETLNHLLQKELHDHRLAESYQAFRARYLRALNKLHPVVYEEPNKGGEMAAEREIKAFLKQLRHEEQDKKVRCQRLQDAWLFYDSVATDKPEVLSSEDKKVEGQMDEIEEAILQEWHEFATDVVAKAEEWDDLPAVADWKADVERFAADLQALRMRQLERDEMRKKAELRRMHQIMRQRRGGDSSSAELNFSDNEAEEEATKKSMKSSRSKKKKKDKEKKKDKSSSSKDKDKSKSSSKSKSGSGSGSGDSAGEEEKPSEENRLLEEVFPPHIAKALREGRKVEAEERPMVTIFFSDIVGFTNISSMISPLKVSEMLDRLYHKFDKLSREHDVYKVETIGDSWMGVTNLVKDQPDHAIRVARFAMDALKAARDTFIDEEDPSLGKLNLRVGFHSGPVVANVVGSRNPRYCLFGDTVNTASRMESHSEHGKIQCSNSSEPFLRGVKGLFLISRGPIEIKGKGLMETFFVQDHEDDEELKVATEMALMAERRPELKPAELRALVDKKLKGDSGVDAGPPGLVPAAETSSSGPPALVPASGTSKSNNKEQHLDDKKSGSGFKFWKRGGGSDDSGDDVVSSGKSRKKGGLLNKLVGGGSRRPGDRRASVQPGHHDRPEPPAVEGRRASLDHRALANSHRDRPSNGISHDLHGAHRRPSNASHDLHRPYRRPSNAASPGMNRRMSNGGRLDGIRIMKVNDRNAPGRSKSLDSTGINTMRAPRTGTRRPSVSDLPPLDAIQPPELKPVTTPPKEETASNEPKLIEKEEPEPAPKEDANPVEKEEPKRLAKEKEEKPKSTPKKEKSDKSLRKSKSKSKTPASAPAPAASFSSSKDLSNINKFLAKSVEALRASKVSSDDAIKLMNEIYDTVKSSEPLQIEFESVDGIQLFTDIVKRFESSEPVLEAAFRLEAVLAGTDVNRDALVDNGNIDLLLKAMKKHTVNAVLQQWAVNSLANLAKAEKHQKAIVELDGIEAVMAIQKDMTAHGAVQVACFRALRALATKNADNAFNIAANGGVWAIMGVLQSSSFPLATVIDLHVEAFHAMAELARESDANRGSLAAAGAIPKVIGAVTCFLKNANLTEAGISALYCMSIEHTQNCDTIVAYNGIKSVIDFMQKHKNHQGTQEKGVLLLASLIEHSNTAQFRTPDETKGAVEHALSKNPDNERLQEICRELLDAL
eukprot:scaffold674_cov130-Amphora_coffeaeformis.AAC.9